MIKQASTFSKLNQQLVCRKLLKLPLKKKKRTILLKTLHDKNTFILTKRYQRYKKEVYRKI